MRMRVVAAVASVVLCAGFVSRAAGGTVEVLPGGSTVAGKTIGQWTEGWWNWAFSFPSSSSPFQDPTGVVATQHQSGPVFYLAGTSGGTPISRSFQVPGDRYVLFPLLNLIVANGPDAPFPDTRAETTAFGSNAVNPSKLVAEVDGQPVSNLASHREPSSVNFTVTGVPGEPFAGTFHDANSDGYWLMLAPLGSGTHTLHFGGATEDFKAPDGSTLLPSFSVDVTDRVTAVSNAVPLPPALGPGLLWFGVIVGGVWLHKRRRSLAQ
jgi:hypothetical protein